MKKALLYALITSVLLSLSWPYIGSLSFLLPFAFFSFFKSQEALNQGKRILLKAFLVNYISFLLFNLFCTYWVYNASAGGAIGAFTLNALFMSIVSLVYLIVRRKRSPLYSFVVFAAAWLAFEYLHLNWELSWPWLTLGNGFANHVWMIQWYQITGVLGGSLWILGCSFLLYRVLESKSKYSLLALVYLTPILISSLFYLQSFEDEQSKSLKVGALQPNLDAYEEKFTNQGIQKLWSQIQQHLNSDQLDVLILPETALFEPTHFSDYGDTIIPYGLWLNQAGKSNSVRNLKHLLAQHPKTTIIAGVDARILKSEADADNFETRKMNVGDQDFYYQNINGSILVDTSTALPYYIKSKLVIGVETYPYPEIFIPLIGEAVIDKGGTTGSLGTQKERTLLSNDKVKVATPICYESIYGDYCGPWNVAGADFLAIVTNDGWWKDTPGYKQHLSLARLRAIESRKWVVRSANTGTSAFINPFGQIEQEQGWFEEGILNHEIKSNQFVSFYAKNGDILGRVAVFLFLSLFLFSLVQKKLDDAK